MDHPFCSQLNSYIHFQHWEIKVTKEGICVWPLTELTMDHSQMPSLALTTLNFQMHLWGHQCGRQQHRNGRCQWMCVFCVCVCMRVRACNTGGKCEHIGKNTHLAPLQIAILQVWGQHVLRGKGGGHLSLSVVPEQLRQFPLAFHTLIETKALTPLFKKDHLLLFPNYSLGSRHHPLPNGCWGIPCSSTQVSPWTDFLKVWFSTSLQF